jgi:uncharacterized membrane protein YfcA
MILDPATFEAALPYFAVGFGAQLIDGALGMAFGLISNTLLVSILGMPPSQASARVHLAEVFTTAASGISHVIHRNVDWRLFGRLVVPGMIGGVIGAYALSNIDASVSRPFVMAYLTLTGLYLLWRAWHSGHEPKRPKVVAPLALAGGFLDAAGGGGWGPVVTSNLLLQGTDPRKTVGTVNTAEFFLTTVVSIAFIVNLGWTAFTLATLGLIAGGVLAAPFGAYLARRVPARTLLLVVGAVLSLTSAFSVWKALI